ncbi:MAG: flagellar operon protein [Thermoleophilia bacterium]|nr:flagellar operon protein [Thermoleophilia bacterium]
MSTPERINVNPATIRPLGPEPVKTQSSEPARTADGRTFADVLRGTQPAVAPAQSPGPVAVPDAVPGSSIKWSAHATARLRQRGIELSAEQHTRLETAVDKAVAKGAKDSLVLLDDNALVVSAQNRTVITALGVHQARENVFTNIDSAVIA